MWRYLAWKDGSDKPIEALSFNGSMLGVALRW
jgi:hypothetical protein